jgi:hypothetical protein
MKRVVLPLLCVAVLLAADPGREAWELLSNAAAALTERDSRSSQFQSYDNSTSFLGNFDPKTPGFAEIRNDVSALLREAELSCSIDLVSNEGDAAARELVVDWTLDTVASQSRPAVASMRRKQRVTIRMEKRKKNWVIVGFEPKDFFSLPEPGK